MSNSSVFKSCLKVLRNSADLQSYDSEFQTDGALTQNSFADNVSGIRGTTSNSLSADHRVCVGWYTTGTVSPHSHLLWPLFVGYQIGYWFEYPKAFFIDTSFLTTLDNCKKMKNMLHTLLGSFMIKYLPSFCFIQVSMMQRMMPHALSMFRLICWANSDGRNCCVPRMMCLAESRTWTRET